MKKKTQQEVLVGFRSVHGDRYDYRNVVYVGNKIPLKIICKKHGEFLQTPDVHKKGCGCTTCGYLKVSKCKKKTKDEVLADFIKIHGDRYNYDLMKYLGDKIKLEIVCILHGSFWQAPTHHKQGKGCIRCAGTERISTQDVIVKFRKTHKGRYDYSHVEYKSNASKVKILCLQKDHGVFIQSPIKHISGNGCPKCSGHGFNRGTPSTLYYLSLGDYGVYKIGITSKSVHERFNPKDRKIIKTVKTWEFLEGETAYHLEKSILNYYKEYQYKGDNILSSGNTELFTKDVLGLDQ